MADIQHDAITKADSHPPADHAADHVDGTDDIQSATGSQKGLATAAQITKLNGIESGATADQTKSEIIALWGGTPSSSKVLGSDGSLLDTSGLGGGGAVASVDGETGTVDLTDNYAPLSHVGAGGTAHANAVAAGAAGFMTGADKTKLNGIESGATADMTASEILSAILAVDGSGSGLDADTIDGHDTSYFAQASHNHAASDVTSGVFNIARLATGTPDGTKFVRDDGTLAVPSGGGGSNYRTLATLASDVTNSTTSFADVTGIGLSVSSGTTYRFFWMIRYTVAALTTGSKWALNGPSFSYLGYRVTWAGTGTNAPSSYVLTTYDSTSTTTSTPDTMGLCLIEGIIIPSASGTLIPRFGSELNASAVVAKADSTLEYW